MYQRSVSLPKCLPEEGSSSNNVELTPRQRKRSVTWQLLLTVLRSSRAFSQARKIIVDNQDAFFNTFSHSSSPYAVIDVQPESFSEIDKLRLSKLVRERNIGHLDQFEGIRGLVSQLQSHVDNGIESDAQAILLRQQAFGSNIIHKQSPNISRIVLKTFKDPILIALFVSASLSLGFGVRREGLRGASDGLFIYVSIFLVMATISFSNIWATRQFHQLSKSNNHTSIVVMRDGTRQPILAHDAVVGDLVCLQIGDRVPADGVYVDGTSLQVSETKEANSVEITPDYNPFLLCGSKVINGDGRMLVTAVGMSSTFPTEDKTPLQVKLHKLTLQTAKIGLAIASIVLVILLIKYFTGNMKDDNGVADYNPAKSIHHVCQAIIGILVMSIVIATTATPEGLLLAATITLAYSTKRMADEKVIVRNLAACEVIGSITVICVDRSGAISSESPQVEQLWVGQVNSRWKPRLIHGKVLQLMHEGIGLNTTSQTEKAIWSWASEKLGMNLEQLKESCRMLDNENLNLQKKEGCIWIQRNGDTRVHIHMKGSMDEILDLCSHYYEKDGDIKDISESVRNKFKKIVQEMKNNDLNCIAYAHAAVSGDLDDNGVRHFPTEESFTLIGFFGLKDLFPDNISRVVKEWQEAGVHVKMITTEDVHKARLAAQQCGILDPNHRETRDDIIEGEEFRSFTDPEILEKAEKYSVIAGASTSDKLLLVQCLKQKGHTLGIIGGCSGDDKLYEEKPRWGSISGAKSVIQ